MKRNEIILTFIICFMLVFNACKQTNKANIKANSPLSKEIAYKAINVLKQNCISCHAPNKIENNVAPSLATIKEYYLKENNNESQFVKMMTSFLLNPTIEQAKMPNAVKKYGLMPQMGMDKEQYNLIASYLFNTKVEDPNWYNQFKIEPDSLSKSQDYLKKGKEVALATKAVLGKNLLNAINTKGTDKALDFCNIKAIPLTDSMAVHLNAKIKRVSDNNRNPNNWANKKELEYINTAKAEIANNGKAKPKVQKIDNQIVGYYPIMTNNMCLQCHGNPKKDIDLKTFKMIKEKYPEDKAVGYSINQLRGIWVIQMDE